MRVLFTTTPGLGHFHPMVPLARAFVEGGDEVCWAAASEVCGDLKQEGFEALPAGLPAGADLEELYRRFPEVQSLPLAERPQFMFPRLFGTIRAAPMLDDLAPIVGAWKPSLIVRDAAEFAGPIAAAIAGVPVVTHSFGGLLVRERVAAAGEEVAPLWEFFGLKPQPYGGSYEYLYLDLYPPSLQGGVTEHVPFTQALRPVAFALGGDEVVPEWIGSNAVRPLVYVTFGTIFNTDVALIGRVVEALRELSVRVIVTVGPKGDRDALGVQPANVHVARYVPQTQLLPACSAVVSHGGSGTFLAALANGLPQVCLPQGADQFGNAAACATAGAGIALEPEACSVLAIRDAATKVLSDPDFKASAGHLSQEIAAMPDPTTVAGMLRNRFGP